MMAIKLSALPPDLRRLVLEQTGIRSAAPAARRLRPAAIERRLSRVCSCLFEMFRPDGNYPARCDGCGHEWPR